MKVITSVQGSVGLKYSPDEAAPDPGVLSRDAVTFIGSSYAFSVIPQVQPGLLLNPAFTFQAGELTTEGGKIPINQVTWASQAASIAVTAKDTPTAELLLDDLIKKLDNQLGFKIEKAARERYYQSNLVVEFEPALEKQISLFQRIQGLLEKELPRPNSAFAIKRWAFGNLAMEQRGGVMLAIDDLADVDFVIERRATEPLSSNRFFCIAPTSTSEHERILNLIERAFKD
jgi:hypothetical protein